MALFPGKQFDKIVDWIDFQFNNFRSRILAGTITGNRTITTPDRSGVLVTMPTDLVSVANAGLPLRVNAAGTDTEVGYGGTPFITSWKTDNTGTSATNQITIPLNTGYSYDFIVDWGDGSKNRIQSTSDPNLTHTYAAIGTYSVSMWGVFPSIRFNNGGDRLKLLAVSQWGTSVKWLSLNGSFYGCSNLLITATDSAFADFRLAADLSSAWRSCTGLTSFPAISLPLATNLNNAWRSCTGLTSFPAISLPLATNLNNAWQSCTGLTSFPAISLPLATNLAGAWFSCTGLTSFPAISLRLAANLSGAWQSCTGLTSFHATGINTNFSVSLAALSGAALDNIYTNLPIVTTPQAITVTGNPGTTSDNPSIATSKGWTVVGT
jgi:hypothetical protein